MIIWIEVKKNYYILLALDILLWYHICFSNELKENWIVISIKYDITLSIRDGTTDITDKNNVNSYLSHRIIDSFPRISKWNIIRLKPVFLTPRDTPKQSLTEIWLKLILMLALPINEYYCFIKNIIWKK